MKSETERRSGLEIPRPVTMRRLKDGIMERLMATADTGRAILFPDRSRLGGRVSTLLAKGFRLRTTKTPEGVAAWCERIEPHNGKSAR